MDPVEIAAGRLQLRPWQLADAHGVYTACQDTDIQRWTTVPSPYTEGDAEAFVGQVAPKAWAADLGAHFGVFDATTGELLASVGLVELVLAEAQAEIGYWTAPWARGRGVATDATLAVARWAFSALGVKRLDWLAVVGNTASRRVAERAGFTVEGTLRSRVHNRDGSRADAWIGSLLPSDLR